MRTPVTKIAPRNFIHLAMISTILLVSSLHAMKKEKPQPQKIQQLLRNTMDADDCKKSILDTQKIYAHQQASANAGKAQKPEPDAIEDELTSQLGLALFNIKEKIQVITRSTQERPTPIPLKNLGYTCSENALTQVLWALPPLNKALETSGYPLKEVITTYVNLLHNKNQAQKSFSVGPFINALKAIKARRLDKNKELADSLDIWELFTECCPPEAQKLFALRYYKTLWCPNETQPGTHDPHSTESIKDYYLKISVEAGPTDLKKALTNWRPPEQVSEVICKCSRYKNLSYTAIVEPPPILVIHTHRWKSPTEKNTQIVTFPLNDLKFGDSTYNLVGVVFHSGTPQGGHYYSWIRQEGKWYRCDDATITELKFKKNKNASDANTHMLFYVR
jgi:hypothetical protein